MHLASDTEAMGEEIVARVREATMKDIPVLKRLGIAAHGESCFNHVPMDPDVATRHFQMAINHQNHRVWLLEVEEEAKGVLIALCFPLWYSKKWQAHELLFYVKPEARGYGALLARRFIEWARADKRVRQIVMGISSGVDMERTGKFYERMGLKKIGANYYLPPEE